MEEHGQIGDKPPIKTAETKIDRPDNETVDSSVLSTTYTELAKDYEFFTPALLNICGYDRNPLVEFQRHCPAPSPDLEPFALDSPVPHFQKLGIGVQPPGELVDWDRRLYAIKRERWFLCRDFIAGLAWVDPSKKIFARLLFGEIEIRDPVAAKQGRVFTKPPSIYVTTYAVSSTIGFFSIAATTDLHIKPFVQKTAPRPDVLIEGQAIAGKDLDPRGMRPPQ